MKWKSLLLFLWPLVAIAAPKKDIHFSYVVSTNDVAFYLNQPILLKMSICEKKEQLCTEIEKTAPFTVTKTARGLHFVLSTTLKFKVFNALITKRKIFWEDAKVKFEIIYARSDIFNKYVQGIYPYKDLVFPLPGDMILKDSVNTETGMVEVSHLLIN